ncbi:MAG: CDP-alcohol phosphatidyltransferase family protein [Spirochaetaceae bacterium]|nr:CDP-alcohol phosphatidyltransferase family protein [Spirochaetaceae bacterium]
MTLADKLTASRLILAPVFFLVFHWIMPGGGAIAIAALWLLFAAIEFSDLLDGMAARRDGTVSPFGKIFDPFADVFARVTYFVCFASAGIMPYWALLLILYREFAMLFLRMLLTQRGVAMGARPGGKLKAVFYAITGGSSLVFVSLRNLGLLVDILPALLVAVRVFYFVAVALAALSFLDYCIQFRKLGPKM